MIEVKNLCFDRKNFSLKNMSFAIGDGEIVGLIGRNGSGKTTTVECLCDFLPIKSGDYKVFGKRMWELTSKEKQQIGIVDLTIQSYKGHKNLNSLLKQIKNLYYNFDEEKFFSIYNRFGLDKTKRIGAYSQGQYEQLQFAIQLSHGTKMIFIDESSAVLDPISKDELFSILREFALEGGSVFITSHILSDLDKLCDRVIVIDKGEIFLDSTIDDLKETYAVIDVKEEDLVNIDKDAIIYEKKDKLSTSLLVYRNKVNETYINKLATLDDIIIKLLLFRGRNK